MEQKQVRFCSRLKASNYRRSGLIIDLLSQQVFLCIFIANSNILRFVPRTSQLQFNFMHDIVISLLTLRANIGRPAGSNCARSLPVLPFSFALLLSTYTWLIRQPFLTLLAIHLQNPIQLSILDLE